MRENFQKTAHSPASSLQYMFKKEINFSLDAGFWGVFMRFFGGRNLCLDCFHFFEIYQILENGLQIYVF